MKNQTNPQCAAASRSAAGQGGCAVGSGNEAALPLNCSYFFNPFNNKTSATRLLLSGTRCLRFTFVHPKLPTDILHILDDSLTLVKSSSKISLWLKPSPTDRITFPPLQAVVSHFCDKWHCVTSSITRQQRSYPIWKKQHFFLSSYSMLQGCPLPVLECFAISDTFSATCRSSSKCPSHAPC